MRLAIVHINVIGAYRRCADKPAAASVEQLRIAYVARTHQQNVGVLHRIGRYVLIRQIFNIGIFFQNALYIRDILFYYYSHRI